MRSALPGLWLMAFGAACAGGKGAPAPGIRGLAEQPEHRTTSRVDSVVHAVMRERGIPGAAVALLRHDTLVLARGYGVAELERGTPVTEETVFQLASSTKPFTAMAVLMLAEEGRVDLDAPAARYLPWLQAQHPSVTVRQLLAHTGGVPTDVRRANVDEFPIEEFRRRFLAEPARSAPGTRWEYANAGYTLLALMVESVSGTPFGDFLQARIFGPLGMTRTGYRVPARQDAAHARGYDWVEGRPQPAPHVFSGWGNSGVESSVRDLARWAAAVERGELLRAESYREMFSPARLGDGTPVAFGFRDDRAASYGLGWFLTRAAGRPVQTHGGAIAGFSAVITRVPELHATLIVLSNGKDRGDRMAQAEVLARAVMEAVFPPGT